MFLKELSSAVQSAQARQVVPNLNEYQPPKPGDTVIASVTDPGLLALIAVMDKYLAEFLLAYPEPTTNVAEMKAGLAEKMKINALTNFAHNEIRLAFGMGPNDPVVLRQGYKTPLLVTPATEAPPNGLTVAATQVTTMVREIQTTKAALAALAEIDAIESILREEMASATYGRGHRFMA